MTSLEHISGTRLHFRSYSEASCSHNHAYHQVILPHCGSLALQCAQRSGEAHAAMAAVIPAGEQHAFSSRGKNAFWVLDVEAHDDQHNELFERCLLSPFVPLGPALQTQLSFAQQQDNLPHNPQMLKHWSQLLLLELSELFRQQHHGVHRRLQLALELMRARLPYTFNVGDLAAELHMSSTQLHRLFRKHLDTTPQRFMHQLRMQHAVKLLSCEQSLAQVAQACGFTDQSSFGKAFKRSHGQSPAQYRRGLRAPNNGMPHTKTG